MVRPPKKKQQRLAFTPMPSSSPAAKEYHKQIQDRAAAVTLEGFPSSSVHRPRKTVPDDSINLVSDDEVLMPTPTASLELDSKNCGKNDRASSSDSEPVRSTHRVGSTKRKRPRQQRLDFNNVREPSSFDSPVQLTSSARTRSSSKPGMFSSQARAHIGRHNVNGDSDEGLEDDLPLPSRMLKPTTKGKSKGKKLRKESKNTAEEKASMAVEDLDDDEIVVPGSRQQQPPSQQHLESSGDDTDLPTTQRRRRYKSKQPRSTEADDSSSIVVLDEEDESDMPTTQGRHRRQAKRARRNSFLNDSPPVALGSDDDLTVMGSRSRAHGDSASESLSEDDDEEEEDTLPKTPGRRGLKQRSRQLSQREKEDLDEDLDFLGPSSDDVTSAERKPRNTQSAQKNAKQQALERLKRARAGQENPAQEQVLDVDSEEEDDEDDEDRAEDYTSSHRFFQAQDEDADFVEEEDEEGPLGVPAGIPLEFTRYASLKPKELFKYAVDWMIQKYINPAFQKRDALYDLTFRKLDDEAQGLAGSKFKSSVWTPAFRYALEARPQMEVLELDGIEMIDHEKCDACNRTSHQCSFKVRFHGKPYHNDTMEEVTSDDEDSESDDESQSSIKPDYNTNGMEIVSTDHMFFVGRFCKSNAFTGHALQHWRFHLNEYVHDYLETAGYFKADELKKRQAWSIKKLSKYANKILKGMERDGEVNTLWKLFRTNVDAARTSKEGKFGQTWGGSDY